MTKIEGPNALEKGGCANELGADLLSQMFDSFFIIIIEFWGITIDSIFWSVKTLSNFYVLGIYKAGEFLSFIISGNLNLLRNIVVIAYLIFVDYVINLKN